MMDYLQQVDYLQQAVNKYEDATESIYDEQLKQGVAFAQAAALISIAQSLAQLAAEKQPTAVDSRDYWLKEFTSLRGMLRDVLNEVPDEVTSPAIRAAREWLREYLPLNLPF